MSRLMLLAGLSMARRRAALAMKRTFLSIASYAAVLLFVLLALGFLSASAFMHLMAIIGAANACAAMAAAYAVFGIVGLAILRTRQKRSQVFNSAFVAEPSSQVPKPYQGRQPPVGIASLGLLAAMGYLFGRSLRRRTGS